MLVLKVTLLLSVLSRAYRNTASKISTERIGKIKLITVVKKSTLPYSLVVNVYEYHGIIINCINLLPRLPIAKITEFPINLLYLFISLTIFEKAI